MKLRKLGGHTCVTRGEPLAAKWKKNYLHILTKYMSKQSHYLNATNINLLVAKPKKLVAFVTVSNQQTTWLILSLTLT